MEITGEGVTSILAWRRSAICDGCAWAGRWSPGRKRWSGCNLPLLREELNSAGGPVTGTLQIAEAYGAPITRLAPIQQCSWQGDSQSSGPFSDTAPTRDRATGGNVRMGTPSPVVTQTGADTDVVVLHEESSAPMHALLSLANTESHNFTAEVLLREAAEQWDLSQASVSAMQWMLA